MLIGCYYRCPVYTEEIDRKFPRLFILAQLKKYDDLSEKAYVTIHDLLGSRVFYENLFIKSEFRASSIRRCFAIEGGRVKTDLGFGKIISRIKSDAEDKPYQYYIKIDDGQYGCFDETKLQIEYSQMDFSPIEQMKNYEFQNPSWYFNHLKVSRNLHFINNTAYGFKVIAGCRVFLLPHQISTITKCIQTYPIRYMLADEVGLGKTIEACSIVKILQSEYIHFRTLYIVPSSLMNQWKNELFYKFGITAQIDQLNSSNCIVAMEIQSSYINIASSGWDMIIVDETHRLLTNQPLYDAVLCACKKTQNLLLLSATPIQDRKNEYLHLLTLLNPDRYENMKLDDFVSQVEKQKVIQNSVNQQLMRMDKYQKYSLSIFDKLKSISKNLHDTGLSSIVNSIDISSIDGGLSRTQEALSYICENYRIERNVIRNRRKQISKKMAKRSLIEVSYTPKSSNEMYFELNVIQDILDYLVKNSDGTINFISNTALTLLGAVFSSPWALEDVLNLRSISDVVINSDLDAWKKRASIEHKQLDRALDEDPNIINGRLMWALNFIDQETDIYEDAECKIVIFTGYNATLKEMLVLLQKRLTSRKLKAVGFGSHMTRNELDDSVYAFQNDINCRIIICDETGGEGRNFQNAKMVLHLDLPWNANTLEQRIGRLDRLGRPENKDVLSVVFFTSNSIEEQLFRVWKDGLLLFQQSLCGLEIITGDINALISNALLNDFNFGLQNAFDDIVNKVNIMRNSVEDEQMFDIGTAIFRPLSQAIDQMLAVYADIENKIFSSALLGWGSQVGMEAEEPNPSGLIEFQEHKFSHKAAFQSLFIPPQWNVYNNTAIMRRERKILGSFDRKIASEREDILFFAPGDVLYDSIISNAVGCSRGRCTAISMKDHFSYLGLIYIFNVVPRIDETTNNPEYLKALAQFRLFLPLSQIVIPIPLTAKSKDISTESIKKLLFSINGKAVQHLGQRSNGAPESPLNQFILHNPPNKWMKLIDIYTPIAIESAKVEAFQMSKLDIAQKEMDRIINGKVSECLFFGRNDSEAKAMKDTYSLVMNTLKEAELEIDSICFLKVVMNE
jgi:ATP-dependent helicase HepA